MSAVRVLSERITPDGLPAVSVDCRGIGGFSVEKTFDSGQTFRFLRALVTM